MRQVGEQRGSVVNHLLVNGSNATLPKVDDGPVRAPAGRFPTGQHGSYGLGQVLRRKEAIEPNLDIG